MPATSPPPTATPTPTASTTIDGCVSTATVRAVPADTFELSISASTVSARSFVATATLTATLAPAAPTAIATDTASTRAVMLPLSVAFTSTAPPAVTTEEPVTAAVTVEVSVLTATGTATETLIAMNPTPRLTETAVGFAVIAAVSSAVTLTAPSVATTREPSI